MATFQEIFQNYVNLPYEQLLSIARGEFEKLSIYFQAGFQGNTKTACQALLLFVSTVIGADGKLTGLESRFLNDLIGQEDDYEATLTVVASLSSEESRALADELIDALPTEAKAAALTVALCFCAVDETISRDEIAYFTKLME